MKEHRQLMQGIDWREGETLNQYNARYLAVFAPLKEAEKRLIDQGRSIKWSDAEKMIASGATLHLMHEWTRFYVPGDELMLDAYDGTGVVVPDVARGGNKGTRS